MKRLQARTRTHTHTHLLCCTEVLHTLVVLLYYHCQNWLHGPHSGGEPAKGNKTGGPIGNGDTSLTPQLHGPLGAVGDSSVGLQDPHMREVGYGLERRHQSIRPGLLAIRFPTYTR